MPSKVIWGVDFITHEARDHFDTIDCEIIESYLTNLEENELCEILRGADAVIAGGEYYNERVFQAAENLKIVARLGAGYDHVDLESATKHGVWVTTTPGATSNAVADFTLGLILMITRNIHGMAKDMDAGRWNQFKGLELAESTLGIIGAGSIGKEVIKRARGFGTYILAYDINPDEAFAKEWSVKYVALDELVSESDIISIHTSYNEGTRHIIDKNRLNLMKHTAYLINTSRAEVIEKNALIEFLKAKKIAGAAIDVHDAYPCSPDDPLVHLDNVIATPWSAYNTNGSVEKMCITATEEAVAVLQGDKPRFPVNRL